MPLNVDGALNTLAHGWAFLLSWRRLLGVEANLGRGRKISCKDPSPAIHGPVHDLSDLPPSIGGEWERLVGLLWPAHGLHLSWQSWPRGFPPSAWDLR